jgi:hypothetical protein
MPVRLTSRDVHDIANLELPWWLAFAANQARAHGYGQDLAAFVRVPEGPSAGGEADVVAHA